MKEYVGIYDEDKAYSAKLALALLNRKVFSAEIVEFTKTEKIEDFLKTGRLLLLLIAESAWDERLRESGIKKIILLSESPEGWEGAADGKVSAVFKYQSVTGLSNDILQKLQTSLGVLPAADVARVYGGKQIIGVYSPVRRCLKSTFAIAAAQIIGEQKRTLLLNFEEFSAFRSLLFDKEAENQGDLSDALYYFLQGELPGKEGLCIRPFHSFDCIVPTNCPEDIRGLKPEEVTAFLRHFLEYSTYQCLVVDFGDALAGMEQVLEICGRVYMPVREDLISETKKQSYLEYLQRINAGLAERITEVKPPYQHMFREQADTVRSGDYFHQIADGAFFDYVRRVL